MSPVELASMLGIVVAIGAVVFNVVPPLLRKRCPECNKRTLALNGFDISPPGAPEPRAHRIYTCGRCEQDFATADGRAFILKSRWDEGFRTPVPTATLVRD